MNDHDIATSLYIAEMQALIPVAQRHLNTLSAPATIAQKDIALREMERLATAMADLSSGYHANDCAFLAQALADVFNELYAPATLPAALFAAIADLLAYMQRRITLMSKHAHILAPDEADRQAAQRLVTMLSEARHAADTALLDTHESPPLPLTLPRVPALRPPMLLPESLPSPRVTATSSDDVELVLHNESPDAGELEQWIRDPTTHPDLTMDPGVAPSEVTYSSEEIALLKQFSEAEFSPPGLPVPITIRSASNPSSESHKSHIDPRPIPTAEELDEIPPEMKRLFVIETAEDLQDLQRALLDLERSPDSRDVLQIMGRIAHKIKGTAATIGFEVLASLMLTLEDMLQALRTRRVPPNDTTISVFLRYAPLIQTALDMAADEQPEDRELIQQAKNMRDELLISAPQQDNRSQQPPMSSPEPPAAEETLTVNRSEPGTRSPRSSSSDGESVLRVDLHRLNDLMGHMSALTVNRAALTQTRDEVVRLQDDMDHALMRLTELSAQITDLQPLARNSSQSSDTRSEPATGAPFGIRFFGRSAHEDHVVADGPRAAASRDTRRHWDELELDRYTEWDHTIRALTEVVADMTTTSRTLRATLSRLGRVSEAQAALTTQVQRDVMHVRLVPMRDLVPRLQIEVKRLIAHTGKQVAFSVQGETIEIDRNISEALTGPLVQLLRNAILHGVESPDERIEQGKSPIAQLTLSAHVAGSEVIIELADDGEGVNPHLLVTSAKELGILDDNAANALNEEEALDLMFIPGVTTHSGKAQTYVGRGVGLDEVYTTIQQLKGSIRVHSVRGQGTSFRIQAPISLSNVRVLYVYVGAERYAVPFSSVVGSLQLRAGEILTGSAITETSNSAISQRRPPITRSIRLAKHTGMGISIGTTPADSQEYETISAFALAELLGNVYEPGDQQTALLVEVGRRRVAMLVDDVRGDEDVVAQTLPRHLHRRVVRGATVTSDGQVQLLLDLHELASTALNNKRVFPAPRPRPVATQPLGSSVLLVDDSPSIRRIFEAALTRAGFEVQFARDGIEAFDLLLARPPRVMVLDIEMPRLDGFELLSIMRESPQFQEVRVVMLTSRAADKHREHALHLGAAAYLVKPCPPETLVEVVSALLREPHEPTPVAVMPASPSTSSIEI